MARTYSLRQSNKILHHYYHVCKKRGHKLSGQEKITLEDQLKNLERAVLAKQKERASELACGIEKEAQRLMPKSAFAYLIEIAGAIIIALLIAVVVRQMWFELYEIPTGSMRPTLREQDRLTVTKTSFGLNIPVETAHFYFDPDLVERARVFIFSGANIPSLDETTTYFGLLPYTKRYVKRMIGKPEDTLYFYGGQIYGIDKDGEEIKELINDPWMKKIEHIPFITFEGTMHFENRTTILFSHMGEPIGRMRINPLNPENPVRGEIKVNGQWKPEEAFGTAQSKEISSFGDFWGIGNFAMARLLNREELVKYTSFKPEEVGEGVLYLQLKHGPNLTSPSPFFEIDGYRGVKIPAFESVIPLQKNHLNTLMDHMYTSRFVVKNGKTRRYNGESEERNPGSSIFHDIPDGTYEMFNGKAEKIGFAGWSSILPENHPLNSRNPENIKTLYNVGIDIREISPALMTLYPPHRYVYYREGDLYALGAPVFKKDDPALKKFVEAEKDRAHKADSKHPFIPFLDRGPPLKDGKIDAAFIHTFGIKIPEQSYFALGDNHANSKDSRFFGFVPQNNLQGAPSWIIWPPGPRWGYPPQLPYPFLTLPRIIVWYTVAGIFIIWQICQHRRLSRRLYPDE